MLQYTEKFRQLLLHMLQAKATPIDTCSFEEGQNEAICGLLAAHAQCQLPVDIGLTDGKHHHLFRLRNDQLLVYENCTPKQVLCSWHHHSLLCVGLQVFWLAACSVAACSW